MEVFAPVGTGTASTLDERPAMSRFFALGTANLRTHRRVFARWKCEIMDAEVDVKLSIMVKETAMDYSQFAFLSHRTPPPVSCIVSARCGLVCEVGLRLRRFFQWLSRQGDD